MRTLSLTISFQEMLLRCVSQARSEELCSWYACQIFVVFFIVYTATAAENMFIPAAAKAPQTKRLNPVIILLI